MTDAAKHDLPTTIAKRELLYGKGADAAALEDIGRRYLAARQAEEAALFFHRAGNTALLKEMLDSAKADGDLFLANHVAGLMGIRLTGEECLAVAERARSRGWEAFARRAEQMAGKSRV